MNTPRLIEDYLPIQAISAEASREKNVRKGHISTLHLWWARRPLVACRAAVYGVLVPASRFIPQNGPDNKKPSLGRANAAKFIERLCKYPGDPSVIQEAQRHILEAHAERLTEETGKKVTVEDIEAGRAPRPKVLDMFAGGGAIPLEALRLGCEAYALDLNPVAHIIELCTLMYPQKYGKPDLNARGMTGSKNTNGESTWGGLANEVRYWGEWVLKKVQAEIGDLYPPIPDPESQPAIKKVPRQDKFWKKQEIQPYLGENPEYLTPVAYLWTRTVQCKNPNCGAVVPLVKQTWLCKKSGRYVALKIVAPKGEKKVHFKVVEATTEKALGFDPSVGSKGGNATCPFCGTVADSDYVKAEGCAKRMGQQMMAIACTRPEKQGKIYLSADDYPDFIPDDEAIRKRIEELCKRTGLTVPDELISEIRPSPNARGMTAVTRYGLKKFGELFSPRQIVCLLMFTIAVRDIKNAIQFGDTTLHEKEHFYSLITSLALLVDRVVEYSTTLNRWDNTQVRIVGIYARQAVPMIWDFAELVPHGNSIGSWSSMLEACTMAYKQLSQIEKPTIVERGTAAKLQWGDESFDAVVTDPPYYDNIPYGETSDFFYVWLKRLLSNIYAEHFSTILTPKKSEATALSSRHAGDMSKATKEYESIMLNAFKEAQRVLKPGGQLTVVYAHKTTLGWSTLVNALRQAGFIVIEAWPLDTEQKQRLLAMDTAALASSIFLVARKREGSAMGSYEDEVRPELEAIVHERVESLWNMGITGADLVIAAVGAGLRAFTRFSRVEYANGEEVPAERFLSEVETVVLEHILARLAKEVGGKSTSLAGLDAPTRFYILWRYTYRGAELDAGEAIIFANGTHVELDGPTGLSSGKAALLAKKKDKYQLKDFQERGEYEDLGLPSKDGERASLIDVLHRVLWLMEKRPGRLADYLREAQPHREQLRLAAQVLAGPALKGGELVDVSPTSEQAALAKLTANWQNVIEHAVLTRGERESKKTGQIIDFGESEER